MDNLTIQPQSQPVSHLAETQAKFKGMHPDRIILMRSKDWLSESSHTEQEG